ncbi:MAG TPA: tRNA 2-thiouridine(34) synthase MnmA [Spirochaetia bacterium]|nr:tRNA 2-thiouridine(34) synthase MnmA [Spirochaetaceae bacterium]HPE90481.1 tRNA 2-thiouridine(34) synthase MnmA [Spirochaetales bacterium]HRW23875.1 tRNA 2-thiouridine(34) synthase MnmA [Spirochaetia bacterium]
MNGSAFSQFRGRRVAVGLSGGVDSSTALALLAEAGADAFGLSMRIWRPGAAPIAGVGDACYGPGELEDVAAAEALCAGLGVPYRTLDLSAEYEARILGYFKREYLAGRTPNPCVRCNQEMKFGFLLERARSAGLDFELFATGHYARIEDRAGRPTLRRAADETKDQSYFIHRLSPATLSGVAFPLGGMTKAEVRAEARRLGLEAADKPESQDFIPGGYGALFDEQEPGDIVDEKGNVLGRHRGIVNYTIGQRRGLGVSTGPEPLYVAALDAERNRVVVTGDERLFCSGIEGGDAILHAEELAGASFEAFVRIRQNHRPAKALVTVDGEAARVEFASAQRAAAPGQSAVFYDADGFVLGGCVIERALR